MTQEPVGKLICQLAVPCIVSMMITAIYNTADTFFVGQLDSNSATGAIGVAFSLMSIIQATGFFYGHGSGNYIHPSALNFENRTYYFASTFRPGPWVVATEIPKIY